MDLQEINERDHNNLGHCLDVFFVSINEEIAHNDCNHLRLKNERATEASKVLNRRRFHKRLTVNSEIN